MTGAPTARRAEAPASLRLGVVGWPVAHSRSPAMHNAALAAVGLAGWRYGLLPVPPHLAAEALRAFGSAGLRGVNVTIPHKATALAVADVPSERARAIGAANTLLYGDDGRIEADNTDAPALLDELARLRLGRPARAIVLGAGGSARAAVWALRDAGVPDVLVRNRTASRARALVAELGGRVLDPGDPLPGADLLVNCTAVGLAGEDPFAPAGAGLGLTTRDLGRIGAVADYVYAPGGTGLVAAFRRGGLPAIDGLELLLAQGALAFRAFTGRPAPRAAMEAAVWSAG